MKEGAWIAAQRSAYTSTLTTHEYPSQSCVCQHTYEDTSNLLPHIKVFERYPSLAVSTLRSCRPC
jgi:hypothetical protein